MARLSLNHVLLVCVGVAFVSCDSGAGSTPQPPGEPGSGTPRGPRWVATVLSGAGSSGDDALNAIPDLIPEGFPGKFDLTEADAEFGMLVSLLAHLLKLPTLEPEAS